MAMYNESLYLINNAKQNGNSSFVFTYIIIFHEQIGYAVLQR